MGGKGFGEAADIEVMNKGIAPQKPGGEGIEFVGGVESHVR
jgi:hypothetical protein